MWCIQTIDSEFRKRMYDVLDLYEENYDPKRPIVCLDEKPKQLIEDKRKPIPMKPGSPEKYDYEYIRNGIANIFMAVEFKAGKRVTQVTERRTMTDFAQFMKVLVIDEYSETEVVRVISDNLNIHKEKAFYEAFSEDEAHFRQVDVKIHLIHLLISIFLKLSEINFNQKLLKVDHNIINIYFITNGGNDILITYIQF